MMMHRLLLVFSILILPHVSIMGADRDSLLRALDKVIENRQQYESSRRDSATAQRRVLSLSHDPETRYHALEHLAAMYRNYRLDSVLFLTIAKLDMARASGRRDRIASTTIQLSQAFSAVGDKARAASILDTLDHTNLDPRTLKNLYSAYYTAYHGIASSKWIASEQLEADRLSRAYRDSVVRRLPIGSVGWLTLEASRIADAGMVPRAIELITRGVRDNPDYSQNASLMYQLGNLHLMAGNTDEALEALTRASIRDITDGKKEYMSLIALARALYDAGDIKRAFSYILTALDDAQFSHASIRTNEIMTILPIIESAYRAEEETALKRASRNTYLALGFGLLVIVALLITVIHLRTMKRLRHKLAITNEKLHCYNRDLEQADALKLHHVEDLLELQAANIAHLKEYRRELYRMMTVGQYGRVIDRLKVDKPATQEMRDFYQRFDATILSMFPDFIAHVNSLMTVPLTSADSTTLTPELRIIALTMLGFSSTSRIVAMLQYTPQTVYNYRSNIRSMLAVSPEEFEASISTLKNKKNTSYDT